MHDHHSFCTQLRSRRILFTFTRRSCPKDKSIYWILHNPRILGVGYGVWKLLEFDKLLIAPLIRDMQPSAHARVIFRPCKALWSLVVMVVLSWWSKYGQSEKSTDRGIIHLYLIQCIASRSRYIPPYGYIPKCMLFGYILSYFIYLYYIYIFIYIIFIYNIYIWIYIILYIFIHTCIYILYNIYILYI